MAQICAIFRRGPDFPSFEHMIGENANNPHVAVVYYSSTGTVAGLARAVVEGAKEAGAGTRLRRVSETAPPEAIAANEAWAAHRAADEETPEVAVEDLLWADAVVFGTPTRFGNVSSQLKSFLDTLGGPWSRGELADKVYSGFVSSDTAHGGQESTLLALYHTVHHFGGVLVAPGYTDPAKFADGNPYGTGHVAGSGPLDGTSLEAARVEGRRVARIADAVRTVTPARS